MICQTIVWNRSGGENRAESEHELFSLKRFGDNRKKDYFANFTFTIDPKTQKTKLT